MDKQLNTNNEPGSSSDKTTFKKRKGTTDVGKDYENVVMASLALNSIDSVDDFRIWSNDDDFGSFDDVIFESGQTKCAIQLKHSMTKEKPLILNQFLGDKGDFSIRKYFQSFLKQKKILSDYKLILFTNRTFNPEIGKCVTIEISHDQKIDLTISKTKFEIDSKTSTNISEDCKMFFKKFFLYTNQSDVKTLEKNLRTSIKEKISCRDEVTEQFTKFFSDWNLLEGTKEIISKPMIKQLLAMFLLSPYIHQFSFNESENKNYEILQKAILKFNVSVFDKKYLKHLQKVSVTYKNLFNTKEAKIINRNYQLTKDELDNLSDVASSKLLWLMDKCPLIVDENPEVWEAIKLCDNKSFILLTNNLQQNFKSVKVFQKLSDLKIDNQLYKNLVENCQLLLSGKKINLVDLLKDNDLQEKITTNDLLLMTNDYEIEQETENLSDPYIPRKLSINFVDLEFLSNAEDDTLILISNVSTKEQNDFIKKHKPVDVEEYLKSNDENKFKPGQKQTDKKTILVASKSHCTSQEFQVVCSKRKFKSCHCLKFVGNKLEWVQSVGDVSTLRRFLLQNSPKDSIKEDELQESNSENNIHLVVGDPGLGKSLLLKSLKNQFISNNLTTLITPHDMKKICHFYKNNKDINNLNQHILKIKYLNWSQFDHHVVNSLIKTQSIKVVYFWDALDEIISDQNREVLIKIIHKFSEQGIVQWMTCRNHLKSTLESEFNVLSQTVFEFDKDQQVEYIKMRLQSVSSIQNDLDLITEKIIDNVTLSRHRDILSIPLQIYMLTETLRENENRIQNFTESFFSLGDLYEYFVDGKINFCYKKNPKFDDSDLEELSQEKEALINQLESFALNLIFSDDVLNHLNLNRKEIRNKFQTFNDRFGFVTEFINSEGKIKFAHISYAEYLAARYLAQQKMFKVKDFIFDEKYTNVRYFFDLILAKNFPAHIAVLCDNKTQLRKHKDKFELKDAAGRTPLQLACSWGKRYKIHQFVKTKNSAGHVNFHLDYVTDTVTDNPSDNLEIIDILSAKCDVFEKDSIFKMNAINYAEETDNIFALAAVVENFKVNYFSSDNYNIQCNVLYLSVLLGVERFLNLFKSYLKCLTISWWRNDSLLHLACDKKNEKIVELLIKAGADINASNKDGETSLLLACAGGHEKIVELLVKAGADINASNKYGETSLFHACVEGHEKIVEMLVKAGADINASNKYGETFLFHACAEGHEKIVEFLVKAGADINASNENGDTSLIRACAGGHEKIVEMLVKAGADINAFNKYGSTSLIRACAGGHEKIVELLVKAGADINASNENGDTSLILACDGGHEKIVELLVKAGVDTNASNKYGSTSLIHACAGGHEKIVELLVKAGADINASNENGDTSLILACDRGHEKIVELLVKAGADINAFNKYGETSLFHACVEGHEKIVELLVKAEADINASNKNADTSLILACAGGHEEIIELLVKAGADINASNKNADTSLILACAGGHEKIVELLVKASADINASNKNGDTSLILACDGGHEKIVELLVKAGADINASNKYGETFLFHACAEGHEKIVELLVKAGADINASNKNGDTSLIRACAGGHEKIVELLVKAGADINASNENGDTSLILACDGGHEKIVEFLVKAGADINASNKYGSTSLIRACAGGHEKIVELLVKAGADINASNENGDTSLILACAGGHEEIIELLVKAGADINASNKNADTSLILACAGGHEKIVELLVKAGADINASNENGDTSLILACDGGHEKIVELLVKAGADINASNKNADTSLILACAGGHEEIIELLVKAGADINASNKNADTSLILACAGGHEKIVELLVKASADINASNKNGDTSLILACAGGHEKIVELLVKAGADINASNENGDTSLILACDGGHEKIVELLVKAGADINASNKNADTSLILACAGGHEEIIELLVKAGADINASNKNADTSLILACAGGHEKIVELLVKASADINASNKNGDTSLILACAGGHEKIVELLVKAGADINASNENGDTSLILACDGGHEKIVELLVKAGADINASNKNADTSLILACAGGHEEIIELLVKAGADINASNENADTSLILACAGGHEKIVELLVKAGADINASNENGDTSLILACDGGHEKIVELLVKAGADINAPNLYQHSN